MGDRVCKTMDKAAAQYSSPSLMSMSPLSSAADAWRPRMDAARSAVSLPFLINVKEQAPFSMMLPFWITRVIPPLAFMLIEETSSSLSSKNTPQQSFVKVGFSASSLSPEYPLSSCSISAMISLCFVTRKEANSSNSVLPEKAEMVSPTSAVVATASVAMLRPLIPVDVNKFPASKKHDAIERELIIESNCITLEIVNDAIVEVVGCCMEVLLI
mmetsp:Transcript_8546/g.20408  ORF Transcript_8546/g.20408 Transcript_8546/m.20408 type:complete len:214 (+) Transcript_8546:711-1352(+)